MRFFVFVLAECWNWREKGQFLEAPLPVSSDEASKSSRLKALRPAKEPGAASIGKRSSITVVYSFSREIGRNISFRCAFFRYLWYHLLPLVVLVVSNRNLCAQVFFLFFSSPNPRKNSHWRMVWGWGLKRRPKICLTAKGCLSGPGSPPESPTRVNRLFFHWIGLVRGSRVSISLSVLASKELSQCPVSTQSLTITQRERSKLLLQPVSYRSLLSFSRSKTPSRCGELSRQPRTSSGGTDLRWSLFMGSGSRCGVQSLNSLLMTTSRNRQTGNKSDDVQKRAFRRRAKKPLQTGSSWRHVQQTDKRLIRSS